MFCALTNIVHCYEREEILDIFKVVALLRIQKPKAVPTLVSRGELGLLILSSCFYRELIKIYFMLQSCSWPLMEYQLYNLSVNST